MDSNTTPPTRKAVCEYKNCQTMGKVVEVATGTTLDCPSCRRPMAPPSTALPRTTTFPMGWAVGATSLVLILVGAVVLFNGLQSRGAKGAVSDTAVASGPEIQPVAIPFGPAETEEAQPEEPAGEPLAPTEPEPPSEQVAEMKPAARRTEPDTQHPTVATTRPRREPTRPATRPRRDEDPSLDLSQGHRQIEEGKSESARRSFRRAIERNPVDAFAWANLGAAEMVLGNRDEALRSYEEALRLDASNWLAHYNLGLYWSRAGRIEPALDHLEQSIEALADPSHRSERQAVRGDLLEHPDFGRLRHETRFQRLVDGLR